MVYFFILYPLYYNMLIVISTKNVNNAEIKNITFVSQIQSKGIAINNGGNDINVQNSIQSSENKLWLFYSLHNRRKLYGLGLIELSPLLPCERNIKQIRSLQIQKPENAGKLYLSVIRIYFGFRILIFGFSPLWHFAKDNNPYFKPKTAFRPEPSISPPASWRSQPRRPPKA